MNEIEKSIPNQGKISKYNGNSKYILHVVDRQINDLMQNLEIIIVNIEGKIETEEIILFFFLSNMYALSFSTLPSFLASTEITNRSCERIDSPIL